MCILLEFFILFLFISLWFKTKIVGFLKDLYSVCTDKSLVNLDYRDFVTHFAKQIICDCSFKHKQMFNEIDLHFRQYYTSNIRFR